jgi:HNH endonuclease
MADRRQLTEAEKNTILDRSGRYCFIDGHPIESEGDLQFDHIRPVAEGGLTVLDNLAPVCRIHNQRKGKQSLSEYRDQLALERFFKDGLARYLDHVIAEKGLKSGQPLKYEIDPTGERVSLFFDDGRRDVSLYTCPATKWRYFYALIPIQHLKNDKELQPRPLRQKPMLDLYRHFQRNTQLAPSICRLEENGDLLLFDGQHKAAGQIWGGRKAVECKVYISPTPKQLKETNLEAHEAYRQMGFYSSELMAKYADIFGEDWSTYTQIEGNKSESGFVTFLVNTKKISSSKAKSEVERAIHHRILSDPQNKLKEFISDKTRSREQPLTHNRIQKTFFRDFLSPIPNNVEFDGPEDLRGTEERNVVRLMSIVADEGLIGRWDPQRNDAEHRRAERIFSAGAIRAWIRILRDVLNAHLQLYMISPDEVHRVMYRDLDEDQFEWVRKFVRRIFSHSIWDAPDTTAIDISKALTKDDDTTAMNLLKERGLTLDWVLQNANV